MKTKIKYTLGFTFLGLVLFSYFYVVVQFGKGLREDEMKRIKKERITFLRDSLQAEYYKLKIDSLHGK